MKKYFLLIFFLFTLSLFPIRMGFTETTSSSSSNTWTEADRRHYETTDTLLANSEKAISAVTKNSSSDTTWTDADRRHYETANAVLPKVVSRYLPADQQNNNVSSWNEADRRHLEMTRELDALENQNISDEKNLPTSSDNSTQDSAWTKADRRHRKLPQKISEDAKKFQLSDEYARENVVPSSYQTKKHAFSAAWQTASYRYEEPDVMRLKGPSYGFSGHYTYRPSKNNFLYNNIINTYRIDGQMNNMKLKYASMDGVRDSGENHSMRELRGLFGREFYDKNVRVLIYAGGGYRYLLDDNGGGILYNPADGVYNVLTYDREATYWYIPVGGEIEFPSKTWALTLKGEYDFFIYGETTSHGTDMNWAYGYNANDDTTYDQHHGFGLKGALELAYTLNPVQFFVEPFVDYWNIEKSEDAYALRGGDYYSAWEPQNKTTSYGVRLGVKF